MSDNSKLYVGNLPYSYTKDDLTNMFSKFGTVQDAHVITDRESGRSRGFGFVEMGSDSEAQAAIDGLKGTQIDNRDLVVNVARPKQNRDFGPRRY
jgi:cold-inducible RNA-binding protein